MNTYALRWHPGRGRLRLRPGRDRCFTRRRSKGENHDEELEETGRSAAGPSLAVHGRGLDGRGCALLLLAAPAPPAPRRPPHAADAAGDEAVETVVVTGIRHGIEDAIALKRDSSSIVEAISAEDIGKLPDTSIAESISRLPGLTSQRAEGRASAISLRGTDPGFTTALLNGREQVSTGDNRSIEFDQYPSELLSAVVVYKTPDAQLVGQGLAGTIDLRTMRPLDYGKRAMAFNIRGERNSHDDLGADATTMAIARASPTSTSSSTTRSA